MDRRSFYRRLGALLYKIRICAEAKQAWARVEDGIRHPPTLFNT